MTPSSYPGLKKRQIDNAMLYMSAHGTELIGDIYIEGKQILYGKVTHVGHSQRRCDSSILTEEGLYPVLSLGFCHISC